MIPTESDHSSSPPPRRASRRRHLVGGLVLLGLLVVLFSGCMERVFFHPTAGPTPLPREFPGARAVSFDAADGTALHGWFLPAAPDPGRSAPAPTILHVHGNAGNITSHVWFTAYLPAAGINVFIFDYRGYGQSEGRARSRDALIDDTHAALDALLREDGVDPTRVGLYGQSLGGAIGLAMMADRSEVRAAVIESAFDSWRTIAANAVGGDPPNVIGRLVAFCLIRDGRRPADAIARIDRPIMILHGSDDSIVPVSHGRRLADAGPDVRLEILDGGEHNSLRETHPEIEAMVVEFLHERLGD